MFKIKQQLRRLYVVTAISSLQTISQSMVETNKRILG